MSNPSDFSIENGVLVKYKGHDAHVVIPEGVTAIGVSAFYNNEDLIRVEIPNSVTSIGNEAFQYCHNLAEVAIPDSVQQIGKGAFLWCKNLKSATLPDKITHIKEYTFASCQKLEKIQIPGSVQLIGESAFSGCKALQAVEFLGSEPKAEASAFVWCPNLADENGLVIVGNILYGCYSNAEHIIVPEGVTQIDVHAFRECAEMNELTLPSTLLDFIRDRYTYDGPFDRNRKLQYVNVPNSLVLPSKTFPARVHFRVSDSETFFKTATSRSIDYVANIPMTDKDMAYVWLFQSGKKWKELVKQRMVNPAEVLHLLAEIYRTDTSLPEPKIKDIKEYLEFYADELNADAIQSFLRDICIVCPKVKKKLEKESFFNEYSAMQESVVHPIEALVDRCYENPTEHRDAMLKVVKGGLAYADGSGTSSKKAVVVFLEQYMVEWFRCSYVTRGEFADRRDLSSVHSFQKPEEADQIAATIDRTALSAFLLPLVKGTSYRNYLLPFACWATEEDAASAISEISHKKKGNAKDRYWASNMIAALYLSNTAAVAAFMEKDKDCDLAKYLRMRGMSVQEYRDNISLPQWNIAQNGLIASACSQLTYAVTEDLNLRAIDGDQELRSISAKTYPEAAEEYKALKKEVTDFYKKRVEYIRGIYITAEKINVQHWLNTYCSNPILQPVAEKVIWIDASGITFMIQKGVISTASGAEHIPQEFVQIAHVLDLSAEQIAAWQHYLLNTGKKLLIEQVWEPIAAIKNINLFLGMVLSKDERNDFKRALARKSINLKSDNDYSEFDHRAYKYVFSDTGTMHVGNALRIRYRVKEDTGETTLESFQPPKKLTRELNSILFELGRVCVKSAIRQNAAQLLTSLLTDTFTAAQVLEFIRIAQDSDSIEALSVLLNHKQQNFPEFDPLAEFTLD